MLDITPLHLRVDRTLLDPWRKRLLDAADYLDAHGWTQGELVRYETGAVCARGAIAGARIEGKMTPSLIRETWDKGGREADTKLSHFLFRTGVTPCNSVARWNDFVAKSGGEVADMMRKCALEGVDQFQESLQC